MHKAVRVRFGLEHVRATQSVAEVWRSRENREFQKLAHGHTLPICAKCDNIYLYNGRDTREPVSANGSAR